MGEKGLIYVIARTLATRMRLIPYCEEHGPWRMSTDSEQEHVRCWAGDLTFLHFKVGMRIASWPPAGN